MNKVKTCFFILAMFFFYNTSHGSTQRSYPFFVEFHNICGHTIYVTLQNFSHFNDRFVQKTLQEGESTEILSTIANSNSIDYAVLLDYELDIKHDDNHTILNSFQLLELLKSMRNKGSHWTIKDPSLCPRPQDTTQ